MAVMRGDENPNDVFNAFQTAHAQSCAEGATISLTTDAQVLILACPLCRAEQRLWFPTPAQTEQFKQRLVDMMAAAAPHPPPTRH